MQKPNFNNKSKIESILRVDHAGEYGAKRIYQGQLDAIKERNEEIEHMYDQEIIHLKYFESELHKRSIRPTVLSPIWHIGGYLLGYIPAKISLKKAMICTDAVEDVIDKHYESQIKYLDERNDEKELKEKIQAFQAEENEHRNIAQDHIYSLNFSDKFIKITTKIFCKLAIALSKKI